MCAATTVDGDAALRTTWSYPVLTSNGANLEIINNGHVLQVGAACTQEHECVCKGWGLHACTHIGQAGCVVDGQLGMLCRGLGL